MRRVKAAIPDGTYVILVRSLFDTLLPTAIMAVSFVAVGSLVGTETADPLLIALTGLGTLAAAARLITIIVFRRRAGDRMLDAQGARIFERRFSIPYLAFAAVFGAFSAHAFVIASPEEHMLLIGLLFGYGAGVVAGISLRPRIAVTAMLAAILPSIVVALATPDLSYRATGALLALFLAGGIESVIRRHRQTAAAVTMRRSYAELARADDLTGLPNRLSLREGFERFAARARDDEICVVHCLDLDRFKPVNDLYGHPVGDALLRAVSGRLNGLLRRGDIAARVGGDEFVIVQTGARHPGEAELLARRIMRAISQPFSIEGHQITIGTSVGFAFFPEHGTNLEQLIGCADKALVGVKRRGGGVAGYTPVVEGQDRMVRLSA